MVKAVKFGGSSLASAEQFKKVKNIILSEEERRFVVPSAPGKRFSDDIKVTDLLYRCHGEAKVGMDFTHTLDTIKSRYEEIIKGLDLDLSLDDEIAVIAENLKKGTSIDYIASMNLSIQQK